MCIVRQANRKSNAVTQHGRKGNDTLPRQIGCILNTSRHGTGTWRTDTNGTDGLITAVLLNNHNDLLTQSCHKVIDIRIVTRWERILSDDITTDIHNGVSSRFVTDIYTYDSRFEIILLHIIFNFDV